MVPFTCSRGVWNRWSSDKHLLSAVQPICYQCLLVVVEVVVPLVSCHWAGGQVLVEAFFHPHQTMTSICSVHRWPLAFLHLPSLNPPTCRYTQQATTVQYSFQD